MNREQAKQMAHDWLDELWKRGYMGRREVYAWLARETGMNGHECHVKNFDIGLCEAIAFLCRDKLNQLEQSV